ncbi:hypothetical protein ACHAPY_011437 [Fusarium culmorum]
MSSSQGKADDTPVKDAPQSIGSTQDELPELTKAQAKRLLLKTDLVVMPLAILSMTLAYLDKNALGYAAIFGMKEDANLKAQDYSWCFWRYFYIFLIYGACTVFLGCLVFFALPDTPSQAWFFTAEEKKLAMIRLAPNQTGVESNKGFKTYQILECLRDPKCYCIWLGALGYAVTNAGVTNFNPLIIAGYGFTKTKTVLMATPQAAVAMVSQALLTTIALYLPNLRCIFWIGGALMGMVGAIMVHSLDVETRRNASLAGVYLMGFYNVPFIFLLSLSSSNTAGATKKSFMGMSIAIMYAVGNIIGPQFFLSTQAPTYVLGIGAMLCAFALMAAAGLAYYFLCIIENKKRDKHFDRSHDVVDVGLEADKSDKTDLQNPNFRYTY